MIHGALTFNRKMTHSLLCFTFPHYLQCKALRAVLNNGGHDKEAAKHLLKKEHVASSSQQKQNQSHLILDIYEWYQKKYIKPGQKMCLLATMQKQLQTCTALTGFKSCFFWGGGGSAWLI